MEQREFCQPCDEQINFSYEPNNTQDVYKLQDLPQSQSEIQKISPNETQLLETIKEVMSNMEHTYPNKNIDIENQGYQDYLYKEGKKRLVERLGLDQQKCIKLIQMEINLQIARKKKQQIYQKNRINSSKNKVFIPTHYKPQKKQHKFEWL